LKSGKQHRVPMEKLVPKKLSPKKLAKTSEENLVNLDSKSTIVTTDACMSLSFPVCPVSLSPSPCVLSLALSLSPLSLSVSQTFVPCISLPLSPALAANAARGSDEHHLPQSLFICTALQALPRADALQWDTFYSAKVPYTDVCDCVYVYTHNYNHTHTHTHTHTHRYLLLGQGCQRG
jgi:hypothetical protein